MLHYMCVLLFLCTFRAVVTMPGAFNDDLLDNEIQTYNFPFVSREEWNARPPKQTLSLHTPVPYVVIHHSYIPPACYDQEECSAAMRQMQHMHMDIRQWWDVGYNFAIGSDGAAYEGRGWKILGAHSLHFNTVSIGICLIGDWRFKLPPVAQLKTTKALIAAGVEMGYIQPNYKLVGHRQVRETECPGNALYREIQTWDHYSPFPSCVKDLVNVKELDEDIKNTILEKNARA